MRKRTAIVMAVLAMMVLALVMATPGCGEEKGTSTEGGTFYAFTGAEPVSLDPAQLQESEGIQIGKQIFDGLTDNNPETMETVPAMAESWSANADASVWTFKLKKGVKFQNGRECKASDFVYSWSRIVNPETASEVAYHLSPIKGFDEFQEGTATELAGVKAIDDYTLEVTLSYPYSQFPVTTAHPVFSPIPKEVVEQYGSENFSEHPVGTGPFSFVSWSHEKEVVIKKFDDYYGNIAHLDEVIFKIYLDEETGYQDFKAGTLNDCQIPLGQFDAARADFGDRALFEPMLGLYYYGFNMNTEPWKSNKDLRQALNYAVDRSTLCKTVMQGTRDPATGIVPKGIYGFQENAMPYKYDPAKAKDLMSAAYPAGTTFPTDLVLGYNTGVGHDKIAQAVQADFKAVGADFTIEGYEWGTYLDMIQAEQITFFRLGWLADYPTMDNFLYPLFFSENAGIDNMTQYNNPEVDKLIMDARKQPDMSKSVDLYRQAEKMILENPPLIPLMFYRTSRVISEDVGGYIRTAMDDTPYELVYLEKSE